MKCLECGHDLEIMRQELIGFTTNPDVKEPWDIWNYSNTEYAGHCKNCLCDWNWYETFNEGVYTSTKPERIFWG